jgi:MscS family membrane protein
MPASRPRRRAATAGSSLLLVVALGLVAAPALADPHPATIVATAGSAATTTTPPPAEPAPAPAPDSPRASLKRFLDLCRAGEYADAAEYLDLAEADKSRGPLLARHLNAVLDRRLGGKLDEISPQSLGNPGDKLPPGVEEIGGITGRSGNDPVRLLRRNGPDGARWMVSRGSVEKIEDWYGHLRDRWLQDLLPEVLLRRGPKDLVWWQWIALPLLFAAAVALGNVLGYLTRQAIGRLAARTKAKWDQTLLTRLGAPLTLAWAVAAVDLAYPFLELFPAAEAFLERVLRAGFFLALFWFAIRGIDITGERVLEHPTTRESPAARSLIPLATKVVKITAIFIAAIAVLSELGYPVTSLVAGLGIGGVALALAAQKTVENLFGSLSIGVDQPFRVGDYITVDTVSGTVESIGLRSTRIRTLDRTLVTLPNGKLADMRVESFAGRDRIRFVCVLSLTRATSAAAVREVLLGARTLLQDHPRVWPEMSVAFARLGDSSLDLEITAWFVTTDSAEFIQLREDVLLGLLEIVEKAGSSLAYPTRTVRLDTGAG